MIKYPAIPWLTAALVLAATATPRAQEADPDFDPLGIHEQLPQLIRVQVEFIEVPHPVLTRLLTRPDTSADHTRLRAVLTDLIAKGEATVAETMIVTARSGQKATSESIKEFIYPTEYEPPGRDLPIPPWNFMRRQCVRPPNIVAFETRNAGHALEIEPTIGTAGLIDLRFVWNDTHLDSLITWHEYRDAMGDGSTRMPTFKTLRVNHSLPLLDGTFQLASIVNPAPATATDPGPRRLVFIGAHILPIPAP